MYAPGAERVRGTQSFVYTMSWCWRHPSLVGLEVLWRWVFGVGALWLVGTHALRIFSAATGGTNDVARLGLDHLTITDPMGSATKLAGAAVVLLPMVLHVARWMAPLLLVVWVAVSAVGRTMVLRRADRSLLARPWTLMALQLVRVAALAGSFAIWFALMVWAGEVSVTEPLGRGQEPELVKYFAIAIVGTIGLFTLVGDCELGAFDCAAAGDAARVWCRRESRGGVSAWAAEDEAGGDQPGDGHREDRADGAGAGVLGVSAAV